ncbi:peptidase C14, caspase domain-containing protein [Abortiporus biennis]|nr:peptidase C14, caspase domain-containing protein [Abortiporus biennis]
MRSKCNGTKRAMIIGVDYENSAHELQSAITDTHTLRIELDLIRRFPQRNTRIYTDVEDDNRIPTKSNLMRGIKWLVSGAKANDSLFFYFSGHGGLDRDDDSFILTSDDKTITCEELRDKLVDELPSGCRLNAVFDCCHAGNMLNLKYHYTGVSDLKDDVPDIDGESTQVDVICWSASPWNKGTRDGPMGKGYMSNAFTDDSEASYLKMFRILRRAVPGAQLTTSHRISDADKKFVM